MASSRINLGNVIIRPYESADQSEVARLDPTAAGRRAALASHGPGVNTTAAAAWENTPTTAPRVEQEGVARPPALSVCDPSLWVAEDHGRIIAVLGVGAAKSDVAEIRLISQPDQMWGQVPGLAGVLGKLLELALGYCRKAGYLKVILNAPIDWAQAVTVGKRCGFSLNRTRKTQSGSLLEFYVNLYFRRRPQAR